MAIYFADKSVRTLMIHKNGCKEVISFLKQHKCPTPLLTGDGNWKECFWFCEACAEVGMISARIGLFWGIRLCLKCHSTKGVHYGIQKSGE